uniref:Uncharacterized protein n=1 Tax=Avena sativa TaxID=4498 RepID=A0ACD5TPJ4_AVESA
MATSAQQEVAFDVNLVQNCTLEDGGLAGWAPFGSRTTTLSVHTDEDALIAVGQREDGDGKKPSGRYILVSGRVDDKDGLRHAITGALKPRITYRVTGWVSLGASSSTAGAAVRVNLGVDGDESLQVECGAVCAEAGWWTEIKGVFRLRTEPRGAAVYVQGAPAGVDVKVMDLRVFATNRKARFGLLKNKTDKVRKRDVVLKLGAARMAGGGASVRVVQMDNTFPFGTCINTSVIQNPAFVDFFTNHFDWAVFENELKWYHTEAQQGQLNYGDADSLLDFCDRHGVRVRGHCIFWSVDGDVQQWVKNLQGRDQLMAAVQSRLQGLVSRYAGRFPHYDVNNEMLHGRFFRDRLGEDVPALMFTEAAKIDPAAKLFVNDYNVECGNDPNATPEKYIELITSLQRGGAAVGGIGLQGHVSNPVGEVICAALDKLATTGVPIWFTELDVPEQDVGLRTEDLEVVLREAYAHPAVEGVVLWGFLQGTMWRQNAWLVNADGTVNEAGQMFVNLQKEWKTDARGSVDDDGNFKFRGFHGTYVVEVTTATGEQMLKTFTVDKGDNNAPLLLDLADV